ncbi:MAG TPA: hypothetical protein VGO91_12710 [Pyrinomonadaceae bacterium]|jgi:hypothetical protein|nr:hypothetical protein [Pyrinomonadaceae bacterium]
MTKRLIAQAVLLAALLGYAGALEVAQAQTAEYGSVVKLVESHFHVKHKGTPFIANLAVKVVRPRGVRDFKLATFEDQDFSAPGADTEFGLAVRRLLTPTWQPLVQTRNRRDGEQTYVYLREAGDNFKVMVVTIERRDATVLQAEVSPQALVKWIKDPEKMGRELRDGAESNEPQ